MLRASLTLSKNFKGGLPVPAVARADYIFAEKRIGFFGRNKLSSSSFDSFVLVEICEYLLEQMVAQLLSQMQSS